MSQKITNSQDDTSTLTNLGSKSTEYKTEGPGAHILEVFPNKGNSDYLIVLEHPEFTSNCLDGDTLIDVATDETQFPEGIPIKDLVGTTGYVFSFDTEKNVPVVKEYHSVRMTRENANCVEIKMKMFRGTNASGKRWYEEKSIICTEDHPILIRAGWGKYEWVKASELKSGMRLVADQRGYDTIRSFSRHRLVYEAANKCEIQGSIHHVDGNHFNNDFHNLEDKSSSDHMSGHQLGSYGYEESLNVDRLVELYESGENIHSLSKVLGCDFGTILSLIEGKVQLRTQSESLKIKNRLQNESKWLECSELYDRGYTSYQLAQYFNVHPTTILQWVRRVGGEIRTDGGNLSRWNGFGASLPPLNHQVIDVIPVSPRNVYNMEVKDTECFFANSVVVHNCPKTHQPDFGKITIDYIPNEHCVETKSFKLYMVAYRNHHSFMETIVNNMLDDFVQALAPKYLRVTGEFNPRGGTYNTVRAVYVKEEYQKDIVNLRAMLKAD